MAYIQKSLTEGEKIEDWFKLPVYAFLPSFFYISLGVIFLIAASILTFTDLFEFFRKEVTSYVFYTLGLYFFIFQGLYTYFKVSALEMAVTNKRCIKAISFFSLETSVIRLKNVESNEINQSFLGRIFGYGDVILSGIGDTVLILNNVDDPVSVQKKISSVLNKI